MSSQAPRILVAGPGLAVVLAWACSALNANATTYYVRKTGSDSNGGTSPATAWLTLGKAAGTTVAGDTVYVGAGTYSESVSQVGDGTSTNPIKYIADTTGAQTGDAGNVDVVAAGGNGFNITSDPYIHIIGFRLRNSLHGAYFENSAGCVLQNCEVYSHSEDGVIVLNAGLTMTGCTIRNNGLDGIDSDGTSTVTITDCTFHSNGEDGIECRGAGAVYTIERCKSYSNAVGGTDIEAGALTCINCLFYSNSVDGLRTHTGLPTVTIWNCTFAKNSSDGMQIDVGTINVKNSILASNIDDGLDVNGGSVSHTYNLLYGNSGLNFEGAAAATGEITTNPLFVNAAANDFQLGTGSPAINSGTSAAGIVDVDLLNVARPIGTAWDMGCYEAVSGGATAGVRVLEWTEIQ